MTQERKDKREQGFAVVSEFVNTCKQPFNSYCFTPKRDTASELFQAKETTSHLIDFHINFNS